MAVSTLAKEGKQFCLRHLDVFIFAVMFAMNLCMEFQTDSKAVVTCFQASEAFGWD